MATIGYRLHLGSGEQPVLVTALRLLRDDLAHASTVRRPTMGLLQRLESAPADAPATVDLAEPELKVAYTALHGLLDDLGREEWRQRMAVRTLLDKLPDEHAIRAIVL